MFVPLKAVQRCTAPGRKRSGVGQVSSEVNPSTRGFPSVTSYAPKQRTVSGTSFVSSRET